MALRTSGKPFLSLKSNKMSTLPHIQRSPSSNFASSFKYADLEMERTKSPKPKPASDKLAFGRDTSDHMLVVSWNAKTGWSHPKIQPIQPFTLHPTAKTFQFATHIFEGLKAYFNEETEKVLLFRADQNMERFLSSARRCALPDFDTKELLQCVARLVDTDRDWVPRGVPHAALYIRPVLMGVDENFKIGPIENALLYVVLGPVGSYFKAASTQPTRLYATTEYVRAWPGGVGAYKMGANYGIGVYVQQEAIKHGCEHVLWLFGDDMQITEAGSMNVMTLWYNENGEKELITAPLESGLILPGVTRSSLLTIAREMFSDEIKVSEKIYTLPQVLKALEENRLIEMFACGTAAVVTPISEIYFEGNTHQLPTSKSTIKSNKSGKLLADEIVSSKLLAELEAIQCGHKEHKWSFDVKSLI